LLPFGIFCLPSFGELCEHSSTVNTPAACRVLRQEPIVNNLEARLLTVRQAAQYLATTVWCMRSRAWNKEVPSIRLGKRLLFDRQDLDAFVAAKKRAA